MAAENVLAQIKHTTSSHQNQQQRENNVLLCTLCVMWNKKREKKIPKDENKPRKHITLNNCNSSTQYTINNDTTCDIVASEQHANAMQ